MPSHEDPATSTLAALGRACHDAGAFADLGDPGLPTALLVALEYCLAHHGLRHVALTAVVDGERVEIPLTDLLAAG